MTYRPPSARYDRFSNLLRRALDPRLTMEERGHALNGLAWASEELAALVDDPHFGGLITALSAPYQVDSAPAPDAASSQSIETRCGTGAYNLGADLRQMINESFEPSWHAVAPEIDEQIRASDRAIVCARAVAADDSLPSDDLARGTAWMQLIPGTGLLMIWQAWPEDRAKIEAYLRYSLDRGASRGSIPRPLAVAITRELASRPGSRDWFDAVVQWAEAWIATASLAGRTPAESTRLLRHTRLTMRVGLAVRAAHNEVRSPRLLALAELTSVVTLIRAAGRADLVRAHIEANGHPRETARAYERLDRRLELLFEVALGAVLRPPRAAELAALSEDERSALMAAGDILRADPGLSQGLLSDSE